MGLFSSLLVLTAARDLVLLGCRIAGWQPPPLLPGSAAAVLLLALAVTALGFLNARRVARVVRVQVPVEGCRPRWTASPSCRSATSTSGRPSSTATARIVERVSNLQPDAVAITGDTVDGTVRELAPTEPLARLRAGHGSFFVTGNHEVLLRRRSWIAELRRLGVRVLMNRHVVIERDGHALVLAGVTDYSAHRFDEGAPQRPRARHRRRAGPGRRARAAGPPAAHRARRRRGRLPPAAVGPYPRRPVLATGTSSCRCSSPMWRGWTATRTCGSTPAAAPATGARQALRRTVGDHADPAGAGGRGQRDGHRAGGCLPSPTAPLHQWERGPTIAGACACRAHIRAHNRDAQ